MTCTLFWYILSAHTFFVHLVASSLTTFFRSFHLSIFCSIPAIVFGSSFRSLLWFTALRQFQTVQSHAGYNLPWCVRVCSCVFVCACVCGALVNIFAFSFCQCSHDVFFFFLYFFSFFFFLFLHRYIDPCNLFDGARRHDYHHSHNMGCYGDWFPFWDHACGTDRSYRTYLAQKVQMEEKKCASSKIHRLLFPLTKE